MSITGRVGRWKPTEKAKEQGHLPNRAKKERRKRLEDMGHKRSLLWCVPLYFQVPLRAGCIGMSREMRLSLHLRLSSTTSQRRPMLLCTWPSSPLHLRVCCRVDSDEFIPLLRPRGRTGVFHRQRHHRFSLGEPLLAALALLMELNTCSDLPSGQGRSFGLRGSAFPTAHLPGQSDGFSPLRQRFPTFIAMNKATL